MKCEIVTGNMPQLWEDLLSQLHEKEYPSESIRHYREAMGRVDRYMRENQILEYTEAVGETYLATHGGRISSGRQFYMSFYVRRLNDILNKRPYVVVHTRKKQKDLKHFIEKIAYFMKLVGWEQLATQGVPRWQVHKRVAGGSQRRGSVASPV